MRAVLEMFTKGTDKAQKEVGGINKQLDQAADNAERMNKTLNQTKTGKGRPGVDDTKNYRTQRGISGSRGASGRDFAAMARAGNGAEGSFVGAYAALAANVFALTAAFQALSNAARVEQLTKGLELMGARGGAALKITAQNLQQVTDNALSTADAMRAVAQASAAGFGGEEIERLGKVARGASLALGRDMGDSLDRLIKGTIKLEPELLDELGIMTRLDDAVKNYADANGKAVSSLTQTERRQAFMNSVLAEGERKFGDIADQIEANPYDQLSASIRKTSTELGALVNTFLGPIAKFFADNPFALIIPGLFLASKALQGLGITGKMAGLNIEKAFDAAYKTGDIKTSSKKVSNIFEGVANSIENGKTQIKTVKDLSVALTTAEEKYVKKNGALTRAEKTSLAYNKTMLMTSFAVRNAAVAVRGLGAAIAAATLPMLAITAVVAGLTWAFAEALKAWDNFTGNTKEIKESKARMKELADQAKETALQVQLMLEPGKGQAGNAFDAIANSAKAASDELDKFYKLRQLGEEADKSNISTKSITSKEVEKTGRFFEATVVSPFQTTLTGDKAIQAEVKRLQYRLEAEGVERSVARLLAEQFNLQKSTLPPAERFNKIIKANVRDVEESNRKASKQIAVFKDMEESAKNINKLGRSLFPKESENALRDLSDEYNNFYNSINRVVDKDFSESFSRGLANNFLAQKSGLKDSLLALESQGIKLKEINSLIEQSVALENALQDLSDAEQAGDKEKEKIAKQAILDAEKLLGVQIQRNAQNFKELALYLKIFGLREAGLKQSIKNVTLEQKLASTIASNARAYLEINKNRTDARLIAAGGDVSFPEEATYEYALKIARLEEQTANKIADIRKRSIELEYRLAAFTINRSIMDETKKLNELKKKESVDQATTGVYAPGKEPPGRLFASGEVALQEQYIKDLKEEQTLMGNIRDVEIEAAGAQALTATTLREQAQARVEFLTSAIGLERTSLQNAKKLVSFAQKLLDIETANNTELFKGASISDEATAYLAVTKIPALENEKALQENLAKAATAQLTDQKLMSMLTEPQITALEEKVSLANQEVTLINEQINGIRSLVDDYLLGNQQKRVALDLAQKELQASKDLQASRKALSDSAINLERSKIEQTARKAGRELTPIEEDTLRTQKDKAELDNAIQERLFMNTEHDLALKNLELERDLTIALYNAQYAAIRGSLTQTVGEEAADRELKPFRDLIDRINPIFTESISMLKETQANTRQAADNNLQALANSMDGVSVALSTVIGSTTSGIMAPTTVVETPEAQALRLQEAVYQGFMRAAQGQVTTAALGAAAPLFDAAPEGREKALGDKDRAMEIQKQARALSEVNAQAKLLSDLSSTIDEGFNNIFLAAEQGSKAMALAFTDMAKQILRQIALMTIKMLAFKAIEAGLNMLFPGTGAGTVFMNFVDPGAAGGIIGLANGGIMGRPAGGLQGIVKQPTYLVGEGRYNEAVVPLPNGRSIPVQMHGGSSQSNNVSVNVNMTNNGSQTQTEGQDPAKLGQAIAAAVQRELVAQKAPGGLLNRYSAI